MLSYRHKKEFHHKTAKLSMGAADTNLTEIYDQGVNYRSETSSKSSH
jgi:hypothetical protein